MKKLLILLNLFFLLNITFAAAQNLPLDGRWQRGKLSGDYASLDIFQTNGDSFYFSLIAVSEALPSFPIGEVDGVAHISNDCANFSGENGAKLKFCFKDNKIIITQNDEMSYYAGISVYFDGEYTKDPSITPLMIAVLYQEDISVIKRMVELEHSSTNAVDSDGRNVLKYAEHSGNPNKEEIVKYLRTILSPTKK